MVIVGNVPIIFHVFTINLWGGSYCLQIKEGAEKSLSHSVSKVEAAEVRHQPRAVCP